MNRVASILQLRNELSERFPNLRLAPPEVAPPDRSPIGISALDAPLQGGLARGALTELVGNGHGSGTAQVVHSLLRQTAADGKFLALVDGADSFDATVVEQEVLARLLWVRCHTAAEALRATDILLRDHNIPVLVLDLKLNPVGQLRKLAASTWFRYARLLEQTRTAVLIVTPFELVSGAAFRIRVESHYGIDALSSAPSELSLRFSLTRSPATAGTQRVAEAG